MTFEKWTKEDYDELVNIIETICKKVIKEMNIATYQAAKVHSVNSDGTYNLRLPGDGSIISGRINMLSSNLSQGDSVFLCCKGGNLSNSWIAAKHRGGSVLSGSGGSSQLMSQNTEEDTGEDKEINEDISDTTVKEDGTDEIMG